MGSLIEKFNERPHKGTLRTRLGIVQENLNPTNGKSLTQAVDNLTCHTAQLAVIFEGLGIVDYRKAMPPSGPTSVHAIKTAATLNPDFAVVKKLS